MKQMRLNYSTPLLSRMLGVSSSGYYDWQGRPLSERAREDMRLELEIKASDRRTRHTYAADRMQNELARRGVIVGICRLKRLRRKLGIRCKQVKKFKATTNSKHALPVAPNLLRRQFSVSSPNTVWVSDITYIPTDEGWLYLAGHKDLFNGEIVGYAMGERLSKNLVGESLLRALSFRKPGKGLLHHSDRGSQYCSTEYRSLLKRYGLEASMSGAGNCYDNAPMESFWGIIKQELIHHRRYYNRREAMAEIREYIEVFYNRQRIQARLGYLSPAAYMQKYNGILTAA